VPVADFAHDLGERGIFKIGQPGTPLRVRVKQVPQTPLTRLTFEILYDLRVVMRVPRLAHLSVIHRFGRIHVRLHEVQQLRPIPRSSIRGREQGSKLIGNNNSFKLFRCAGGPVCIFSSDAPTRSPDCSSVAAAVRSDQHQDARLAAPATPPKR
jgi:hypothetical protein